MTKKPLQTVDVGILPVKSHLDRQEKDVMNSGIPILIPNYLYSYQIPTEYKSKPIRLLLEVYTKRKTTGKPELGNSPLSLQPNKEAFCVSVDVPISKDVGQLVYSHIVRVPILPDEVTVYKSFTNIRGPFDDSRIVLRYDGYQGEWISVGRLSITN